MESKHIGRVFRHATEPNLCNVVKTRIEDETIIGTYSGDWTIDNFLAFLATERIEYIVEWERPRHWPKGRP